MSKILNENEPKTVQSIIKRTNKLKRPRKFSSERLSQVGSSIREKFRLKIHSKSFNTILNTNEKRLSSSSINSSSTSCPLSAPPVVDKRHFAFVETDEFRGIESTWTEDSNVAEYVSLFAHLNRCVDDVKFIWEKNGHILQPTPSTFIFSDKKNSQLCIKDPNRDYLGNFTCTAISFFGNSSLKIVLEEEDVYRMISNNESPKRFTRIRDEKNAANAKQLGLNALDRNDDSRVDPFSFWRVHDRRVKPVPPPKPIIIQTSLPNSPNIPRRCRDLIGRSKIEERLLPYALRKGHVEETNLDLFDVEDSYYNNNNINNNNLVMHSDKPINRKISVDFEGKMLHKKLRVNQQEPLRKELSENESGQSSPESNRSISYLLKIFESKNNIVTNGISPYKTNSSTTISSYSSSDNLNDHRLRNTFQSDPYIKKVETKGSLKASHEPDNSMDSSLCSDKSKNDSGVVHEELDFKKAMNIFYEKNNLTTVPLKKPPEPSEKTHIEEVRPMIKITTETSEAKAIVPTVILVKEEKAMPDTTTAPLGNDSKEDSDKGLNDSLELLTPKAAMAKEENPMEKILGMTDLKSPIQTLPSDRKQPMSQVQRERLKALYQEQCLKEASEDCSDPTTILFKRNHNEEEEDQGPLDIKLKKRNVTEDYIVMEFLGKGKFGQVSKCMRKSDKKIYAVKSIRSFRLERYKDGNIMEVAILCHIGKHPQIAGIEDIYEFDRQIYIISEYIAGGALYDRIFHGSDLTESNTIELIHQILLGLQHLKKCRIIHRDIKPENLMMVNEEGSLLKIIDFGFACFYDPKKPPKLLAGTPTYSAPETLNYDPQSYATDLWSVGVIAYEILSGLTPFEIAQSGDLNRELTQQEVINNIVAVRYNFEDEGVSDASNEAKDFIRKILVKRIENRPSVDECLKHPWIAMPEAKRPKVQRTLSLVRRTPGKQSFRNWHDQAILELTVKQK